MPAELAGGELRPIATDELEPASARGFELPAIGPDDVAFLQYTSGSTAQPKGVRVTHGNLLANSRAIARAFATSEETVVAGWLPVIHDMGLIGNVLQPIWCGGSCVLMPPMAFLQRPRRWLEAVTRYHATTSGGPDFAYELCVRKVPPESRTDLDLTSWRVAFNGAEPVRTETLERFAAEFEPWGFRRRAFQPCYGLAEATLLVTAAGHEPAPKERTVPRDRLGAGQTVPAAPSGNEAVKRLVSCGRAAPEDRLLVVDPETRRPCPAGRVGEVWLAGPGVADGYWRRPEESRETFGARLADAGSGPFLRTGDLAFLDDDGELYLAGRLKDLIIVRGRNVHPQDVELTARSSHAALASGGGAAFAVEDDGGERLVVVHEIDRRRTGEAAAAAAAVQPERRVVTRVGLDSETARGKDGQLFSLELLERSASLWPRIPAPRPGFPEIAGLRRSPGPRQGLLRRRSARRREETAGPENAPAPRRAQRTLHGLWALRIVLSRRAPFRPRPAHGV
jgi:acyl-CoA synthetase (AMP-forming)/AMP-acid ligase II